MPKRLVKVAKELNVGTSTIVDHLQNNGYEIDNKPTAKITDEMYDELLKEFSTSIAIKEKADSLVIGARVTPGPDVATLEPDPEEKLVFRRPTVTEEPVIETKPVSEPEEVVEKAILEEDQKPKITVVGKIDLTPKEDSVEETPDEEEVEGTTPEKEEEEVITAEAPQLKGLKILGKIDAEKLQKPKKKKEAKAAEDEAPKQEAKKEEVKEEPQMPKPVASSDKTVRKKRKRKRTRVRDDQAFRDGESAGGRGRGRKDRQASKKEIEEKIKSTLNKMNVGGRSKRQKIRRESRERQREKQEIREQEAFTDKLQLTEFVSVSELASLMNVPVTDVITTCMNLGVIVSINQRLDAEIIELIGEEFGHEVEFINVEDQAEEDTDIVDAEEDLEPRAPIVTVMGHVDHGKTSLLDYIRSTSVVSGEAGGITQHIGAYEVIVGEDKKPITFLDTPGHEAFTAMRARGAKVTDVVVIIVAADDNVMPQTKEAISHAQAAGVPIVFAINKIDKPGANPDNIKQELANMNLLVEEWGGSYQSQDISAKTGQNIDLLLEKIILESEVLDLKANPSRAALGTVIEASLDKGRGYVTKLLVQNGTLKVGDPMVAGDHAGKIKAMFNELGKRIKEAGPSKPVLVLGLTGAPQAGEKFKVTESEQEARQFAAKRSQIVREQTTRASKRVSLDEIGRRLALGTFKELNLIVKGDVDGSIEALSDSLIKLSIDTIQVNVIHKAVGQIIESDVLLASASDAIIIGFQVRPSQGARKLAEKEGVEIKTYSIIYEAIEEVKAAIEGMLEPTKQEKIIGQVEIRETYKISKVGTVAGSFVSEGKITRNSKIRLVRDGIVIYPVKENVVGEVGTLRRFKDDVREVKNGMECGITIKNFNDIKVGDVIEVYEIEEIKQTLE